MYLISEKFSSSDVLVFKAYQSIQRAPDYLQQSYEVLMTSDTNYKL